jgi:hypothetical protein
VATPPILRNGSKIDFQKSKPTRESTRKEEKWHTTFPLELAMTQNRKTEPGISCGERQLCLVYLLAAILNTDIIRF